MIHTHTQPSAHTHTLTIATTQTPAFVSKCKSSVIIHEEVRGPTTFAGVAVQVTSIPPLPLPLPFHLPLLLPLILPLPLPLSRPPPLVLLYLSPGIDHSLVRAAFRCASRRRCTQGKKGWWR